MVDGVRKNRTVDNLSPTRGSGVKRVKYEVTDKQIIFKTGEILQNAVFDLKCHYFNEYRIWNIFNR